MRLGADCLFVEGQDLGVAHEDFAARDGGVDAGVVEAVEHVAEEASGFEGGGGDVIENGDVGQLSGDELSAFFGEAAGGDLRVFVQEHVAGFDEGDAGVGEGGALEQVGDAGGGNHVRVMPSVPRPRRMPFSAA